MRYKVDFSIVPPKWIELKGENKMTIKLQELTITENGKTTQYKTQAEFWPAVFRKLEERRRGINIFV